MNKTILLYFFFITCLISCSIKSNSNILDSDDFSEKQIRIETLLREIKTFSKIDNAEFELFNVNGFSDTRTSVPGATSLDYKFSVKVHPTVIDNWINGFSKADLPIEDLEWMNEIIHYRKNEWKTNSTPEYYSKQEGQVILVVFREEGIIYKRIVKL